MLDLNSLFSFFVLGVIGWYTYEVFIWPFYVSPLRKIPGPPTDGPIYGNFKRFFVDEQEVILKWVEKYGSIVKYYGVFNNPTVLIADPNIIHEVTTSQDFIKPIKSLGNIVAIAGKGVLMAEGESHKRQRKMMNPAFAHNNIKEMVPTFVRVASTLKKVLEDQTNAGESRINLTPYISKATLDVIGLAGFNYEFNSLTSSNELAEAYSNILGFPNGSSQMFFRMLSNIFPLARKIPVKEYRTFNHSCKVIERVSNKLIEEKYHQDRNNKLEGKDLLSLLILTNKTLPPEEKMTDDELKNQIMTFLVAGHETTSVSTAWALHLLAQHPHEQDLLREELTKAFPDKSKFNPTYDEINSLEHLNCIVKETLRLNSPVTFLSRTNTKDKVFGDYFIPKDTVISIAISTIHKLPSVWGPTADKFDPKRWLDPSLIKNASNLTYLPFYTGPRTCIGNKLALAEFKVLLATLIMNFDFKPVEGFRVGKRIFPVAKPHPHLELIVSKIED